MRFKQIFEKSTRSFTSVQLFNKAVSCFAINQKIHLIHPWLHVTDEMAFVIYD